MTGSGSDAAASGGGRRDWFRDARVRCGARTPLGSMERGLCFRPELQPHVLHPAVARLGDDTRRELLRRALGRYLHATMLLETQIVNVVACGLAHGLAPPPLSETVRLDALKLYCDEGYHALLAADLMDQLGPVPVDTPRFLERLRAVCEAHRGDAEVITLLFTILSETVLSAVLSTVGRDRRLLPGVRAFVREHARDEAWHAAFFGARLVELWPRLSAAERDRYGALLPELLGAYLDPERDAIARDLRAVGLADAEVTAVMAESYTEHATRRARRRAARPSLGWLRRAGALTGATRRAFLRAGWPEEDL